MGTMRSNVEQRAGSLRVPRTPGVGVEPDEEAVRWLAVAVR